MKSTRLRLLPTPAPAPATCFVCLNEIVDQEPVYARDWFPLLNPPLHQECLDQLKETIASERQARRDGRTG